MYKQELLKRISELEAQNRALVAENERLREALGLPPSEVTVTETVPDRPFVEKPATETVAEPADREINEIPLTLPLINKHSSPEEKIELYMSLFRGRTDVYAKLCYSKKHESGYYIPACKN